MDGGGRPSGRPPFTCASSRHRCSVCLHTGRLEPSSSQSCLRDARSLTGLAQQALVADLTSVGQYGMNQIRGVRS